MILVKKPHPSNFNDVKVYKNVPPMKCCNGKHNKNIEIDNKVIQKILKRQIRNNRYTSASKRRPYMRF